MKKRVFAALMCVSISCGCLAGCEKTPEEAIVREKSADSIKSYESAEAKKTDETLRELLGAPEHYTNEKSYENGGLIIDTDAEVTVPETTAASTCAVSAKEVNQDLIDTVTKAFFDGDTVYHSFTYDEWTKSDYQEQITLLKKYKAEGNLDPYEHGTDENGNLQYDIDQQIQGMEEKMQSAPEENEKEEVVPAFGLEYWNGKGEERTRDIDYNHFGGVVETSQGNYDYTIDYMMAPDITFTIEKRREDLTDPLEFAAWTEGGYLMDTDSENHISEEKIQSMLQISYEDARKIAEESVEKLGWDFKVCDWSYSVFTHGENGAREDTMTDAGYLFYFSREINGIPITQTNIYGGALEDMDSTLEPWCYERCEVIVGDDGIQRAVIMNPYDIGEIQTANVSLMDFDSIAGIYEQMMEISNADITKYEAQRTYHIRKIVFGYTRIYDPTKDNDTGLLVPVWDFFGGIDSEALDGESYNHDSGEHSTRSFLTINAIDGTVIDRELGY